MSLEINDDIFLSKLDEYYDYFDKPYPLVITSQETAEEIIDKIDKAIESGVEVKTPIPPKGFYY